MWWHCFATGEWGWELPGGIVDADEDGSVTAAREVEEENGWRLGPLEHLASFQAMLAWPTPHEIWERWVPRMRSSLLS